MDGTGFQILDYLQLQRVLKFLIKWLLIKIAFIASLSIM